MIQLRLIPIDLPNMKIGRITDVTSKDLGKLAIIDENKSTKLKPQLLIATEESLPLKEGWYYNSAPAVKNVVFINKEDVSSLKVIYGEIPPHLHQVVASSIIQIFPTAIFSDSDLKLIVDFYNKNNQTLPNIELEEPKDGIISIKNTDVFTEKSQSKPDDGSENRKKAMEWWNTLAFETKFYHTIKNNDLIDGDKTRHPTTLTGREIELIYKAVKIKDLDTKTEALDWWCGLMDICTTPDNNYIRTKENLAIKYYGGEHWNLTDSEIEKIYKDEKPDTHHCSHCNKIKDGNVETSFCYHCRRNGTPKSTSTQELKLYSEQDVINALHCAEVRHNKDYTKIWEIMQEWLTSIEIKR